MKRFSVLIMSDFMEIDLSASLEDAVSLLRLEVDGPMRFGALSANKRGWQAEWEYGHLSLRSLDQEDQEELSSSFDLPLGFRTRLWISMKPFDDGLVSFYGFVARLLSRWDGNMAVLLNGDYMRLQRVNGALAIRLECLSESIVSQFAPFSYLPLPIPKEDQ